MSGGRVLHEHTDRTGDSLRVVRTLDGSLVFDVLTSQGSRAAVTYSPSAAVAPLQAALADAVCPDVLRRADGVPEVVRTLADHVEALQRVVDDPDAHGGRDDLAVHVPLLAEAARLLGLVDQEVTGG